jgi:hypothetical protein
MVHLAVMVAEKEGVKSVKIKDFSFSRQISRTYFAILYFKVQG